MKKLKIFLRFEKEERWLERMASQGWLLCGKSFFYCFRGPSRIRRQLELIIGHLEARRIFLITVHCLRIAVGSILRVQNHPEHNIFLRQTKAAQKIYSQIRFPVQEDIIGWLICGCILQSPFYRFSCQ